MLGFKSDTNYKLQDIYRGHHQVTYKGVPAIKSPFDYVLYQMLIFNLKPDLILEIGTNKGGSTLYLADLLELNGSGMIHTVDLPANHEDQLLHQHPRIRVFKTGFEQYDTGLLQNAGTVLVIEDGSHQYRDSLACLEKFAPFVTKDAYYIVEDGIVNELGMGKEFNGGPAKAIHEYLQQHPEFIIDRRYCDFFGKNATFNTNGYLKKIS
jgi:cephalosporin hydroxylase